MIKNGAYFIVIVLFVADLFKIEDLWRHNIDKKMM